MGKTVEVTVAPDGTVVVQTKGYAGADCVAASKAIETALGTTTSERKTAEYYQSTKGTNEGTVQS